MGVEPTDYATGQAIIFVLAEDIGQLLGLVEFVESGTGFGREGRHGVVCGEGGKWQRVKWSSQAVVQFLLGRITVPWKQNTEVQGQL